jgi:nitrogen fixation/metabolism regulation signal transduction histidine kinase
VPVDFDTAAVGRALDNLLLNAIQNSNNGAPVVLRAEIEDGRLRLFVSDSGHGVPEGIREHLFEPFATGRPNGTGLGWRSFERWPKPMAAVRALHIDTMARRSPLDIPIGPHQ